MLAGSDRLELINDDRLLDAGHTEALRELGVAWPEDLNVAWDDLRDEGTGCAVLESDKKPRGLHDQRLL